jgi:neutral amino acid transport system permease protein
MVGYLTSLAIFIATYALFSLGLNLQWGFTGLINFGLVAFLTLGAYVTVLLSLNGIPIIFAALAGALCAALLGLLIGLSTLRLREDYLAIVTIGVAEVVRLIALNEEWLTKGTRGVYSYPLPLDKLEPNIVVKLGMIGILTGIVGLGLWMLWQWVSLLTREDSATPSVRQPAHRPTLLFLGYGLGIVLVALALWLGFSVDMGFLFAAVVPLALSVGIPYLQFKQPLAKLKQQPWATHGTIAIATFSFSVGMMAYWADVVGLWNYTYKAGLMWLLVVCVALVFWRLEALVHSPWGRVLKAVREDEEVAKALGKNVFRYKLQSLMIGGAIAGLAGSFYAWQLTFINPDNFVSLITFQAWIIVVLGGSGNNVGTLLGALIFWTYNDATQFFLRAVLPLDDARLGAFRVMVIGLLMIVLMMWRPQGILGKKDELSLGR